MSMKEIDLTWHNGVHPHDGYLEKYTVKIESDGQEVVRVLGFTRHVAGVNIPIEDEERVRELAEKFLSEKHTEALTAVASSMADQ